jgi:tetratricopeptide (TPR) repeat protein
MDLASLTAEAFAALGSGDYERAAELARAVLQRSPDDPAGLTLFGRLALLQGQPEVARALFDRVLSQPLKLPTSWLDLAQALTDLRDPAAARAAIVEALALDPRNVEALLRLAGVDLSLGERSAAQQAFERALDMDPRATRAYRGLCFMGAVTPDSSRLAAMVRLLRQRGITPRERSELHYGLAQVFRRAGDDDRFINHLLAANELQRAAAPRDAAQRYRATFSRIAAAFTGTSLARSARAAPIDPTPIFVVGMPRSGTTLLEQIIAAHPDVAAGGELDFVNGPLRGQLERLTGKPFPFGFETLSSEHLDTLAGSYGRRIAAIARGRRFVTDKTPGNYHVLGLLRVLFPDAPIIHMRRDPMDTCFSILQQPFGEGSPHTCDLGLLGFAYRNYVSQMAKFDELLPGEFLTVDYEALVVAPEDVGRQVFQHCGLRWRSRYLDFNDDPSPVQTFSALQVRQPINDASIGAWRRYGKALAPLATALDLQPG